MQSELNDVPMSERRKLLVFLIRAAAGAIAAITVLPGAAYLLRPVFGAGRRVKRKILFQKQEDASSPSFVAARLEGVDEAAPGVYCKMEGGRYTVLSATCPHAQCSVRWDGAGRKFLCPCHQGVFDEKGAALSGPPAGPPARSLENLAVTVQNGAPYVDQLEV